MKKLKRTFILLFSVILIGLLLIFFKYGFDRPRPDHLIPLIWRISYTTEECGGVGFKSEALEGLNFIRKKVKKRYYIFSGYRDEKRNKKVGGVRGSQHMKGNAIDLWVPVNEREAFYKAAKEAGFKGFGWGSRSVHIDMGKRRWWTYDDKGRHVNGSNRHKYLYKAPQVFKEDFKVN